jgi:predicted ATPase/DNA-binding SARP family transcriptional activator/Tfp pilus assembly protein PilF
MHTEHTPPGLEIRLLGPLDVRVSGKPLPPLRTRKGQWLLALLALRCGRQVARDWLAGTLWPDSTESQSLANLRLSLADLRRALGEQAYRLYSPTLQTLTLDPEGTQVDVAVFDALIANGDAPSLQQALELYCGPVLEGCLEDWVFPERQAREQAYIQALEQRADLAMAADKHQEAIGYLRRLVGCDPFRESGYRRLMEALAADGDHAAAVLVYRELRLYLHQQLNAPPDPQTSALFERVRAEAGDRLRPAAATPPLRAASPHRLPKPLSSLVGRRADVQEVCDLVRIHRVVTLTGAGGIGKTRLSIAVAEEMAVGYPDGAFFVDLAALTDGAVVPQVVASTLGLREEPGRPVMTTLLSHLESRTILLILDNCEHLIQSCASFVITLLDRCAHLRILATSRQSLGLSGEQMWRVPSLAVPDVSDFAMDTVEHGENARASAWMDFAAVQLFVERSRLLQPKLTETYTDMRAVGVICRRLDGIPLAIELAAARVRVLPIEQIASRLDDRFRLLTGGSRTALPRQQTLRALIDWSYDLLGRLERSLLCRLSVFAGGCTLEAAEKVCTDETIGETEILDLLTRLVDQSLVIYEPRGEEARYRMLETVRQYSRDRLLESGTGEVWRRRHRDYFLSLAEQAEPELTGSDQAGWLARLEEEHDNLRVALEWCEEEPEGAPTGLRMAAALWRFWDIHGHVSEGRAYLEAALSRTKIPEQARGKALSGAGSLAFRQGDYTAARALNEDSLTLFRTLDDRQGIAQSLGQLGNMARIQGDGAMARAYYEQSLAIKQQIGDQQGIAATLNNLGLVACNQGDYVSARKYHGESLTLKRAAGNTRGIAASLSNLGIVVDNQGDYPTARALLEESLALCRQLGDDQGIAAALGNLGNVACHQGDYAAAKALYTESLALRRRSNDRRGITLALGNLGNVALNQGDFSAARALLEESVALKRELGDKDGIAVSLANLGNVACKQGDYAAAEGLMAEGLALKCELGDRYGIAFLLEMFATLAVRRERREQAACLWGAAHALREELGTPLPANAQEEYDRDLTATRETLGTDAFVLSWEAGRNMTLEQSTTYALDQNG